MNYKEKIIEMIRDIQEEKYLKYICALIKEMLKDN